MYLLNFTLSICCFLFYRNHYHQRFLKLSRLTLKVSDNIMLLFNINFILQATRGWEDKGLVTVKDFQNVCKVTCTCTSCKLLPSFPGNVLCTGVGWEEKGQVILAFEDNRNVCKTSCTSCCLFLPPSLVC